MSVDFTAIFKAQDKVSSELSNIDSKSSGLNDTFKKLASTAAGVFSVAAVTSFAKETVTTFATFENGMNEVFTLLPNITEEAMNEMSEQAKDFSADLGVLTEDSVPALYQALSAGVSQDTVFDFLETANKASVGGVTDLTTAVDGLTTVVNSYGSDIMSTERASDVMFTTVKLGKTTFEELSSSLYNVLPTASAAGVQFEDVSAALATLTSQGVPTASATTQLKSALSELTQTGTGVDTIFREISGGSFKEFIAAGGNTQEAFALLESYANDTGLGINDLFSSVEAGSAVMALTGTSTDSFVSALEEMGVSSGATDAAFATMERGVTRTIEKVQATFEAFKIEVGEKLVASFWKLYDVALPVFVKMKGRAEELLPSLIAAKDWGVDAFNKIKNAISENMEKFEQLKPILDDVKDRIVQSFEASKPTLDWLKNEALPGVIGLFGDVAEKTRQFYDWGKANWPAIEPILWGVIGAMGAYKAITVATTIATKAQVVWEALHSAGTIKATVAQWALNAAMSANPIALVVIAIGLLIAAGVALYQNWDVVKAKAFELWEGIQEALSPIADFFSGIWENVKGGFKAFVNYIIGGINKLISGINGMSFDVPDWVPGVGGESLGFSIPEIPLFAKGTTNAPDTFIAGEAGPELITGASGASVFPSGETDRILSALSNSNAPINPTSSIGNDNDVDHDGGEKTFNININGEGTISGAGLSKDDVLEVLIAHIKPVLIKIIQTEIFEEGDLSYEF